MSRKYRIQDAFYSTHPGIRIFFFVNNPDKIIGPWDSESESQHWFVENSGISIINQCAFPYCLEIDQNGSIFFEKTDSETYRIIAELILSSKIQDNESLINGIYIKKKTNVKEKNKIIHK